MIVWRPLALLALLLVLSEAAFAHQPYLNENETCAPVDRAFAEMRVLYGDGIFAAAPARVVLLDSRGRLLAVSGTGFTFAIEATIDGGCRALDLHRRIALIPEPTTFRPGRDLLGDGSVNARGDVLDDTPFHGFTTRRSTLSEHVRAMVLYAAVDPLRWAIFASAGFLGALVFWIGVQPSSRVGWMGLAMRSLRLVFVLIASAALAVCAVGWTFSQGGTVDLLVSAGGLGVATMAASICGARWLIRRV